MFKIQEVVFRHDDEGSGWHGVVMVESQFGTNETQLIPVTLADAAQFHEDLMAAIGQARVLLSEQADRIEQKGAHDRPTEDRPAEDRPAEDHPM